MAIAFAAAFVGALGYALGRGGGGGPPPPTTPAAPPSPAPPAAPGGAPDAPDAPDTVEPPPSATERARWWLDRLVRGPEPTTVGVAGWLPNFHQTLLADAVRNLAQTPAETLDLLADPALLERVTTAEDGNPWHGVLDVLALVGRERPEVARAWARPALARADLTLRRRAVGVLASLADPVDAPLLLERLRADGDDPVIAPAAVRLLLGFGDSHAREAARAVFETGSAEAWETFPGNVAIAAGDQAEAILRWWIPLAETSGPRAHEVLREDGRTVAASDPAAGPVVGPEHRRLDGRGSAEAARRALARIAGDDASPALDPKDAQAARATLEALVDAPAAADPVAAVSAVLTLARDRSPDVADRLRAALRESLRADRLGPVAEAAHDALSARGADADDLLGAGLAEGGAAAHGALRLVRRARDPDHRALLRAATAGADGRLLAELRRALVWLEIARLEKGGADLESVTRFAGEVAGWVDEPGGEGFASALLDLGPPGEAFFAQGLEGPRRRAYLAALAHGPDRRVPAEVARAVAAPLGPASAPDDVSLALLALFNTAPGDAAPAVEAAVARLPGGEADRARVVLRIVRHRAPRP